MFGRGTWAILGLAAESIETFRANLADRATMAGHSQMAAAAVTRHFSSDALGINPFGAPRLDESHPVAAEHQEALAQFAITEREAGSDYTLPDEVLHCAGYGHSEEQFQLEPSLPWYGLWAVSNEWKDVSDLASIREQRSYLSMERPYRFLAPIDKKTIDQEALAVTAVIRKQIPVLLDFNEGRVYIESSNKKVIPTIVARLQQMGADINSVAWTYDRPNWTAEIIQRLYEQTQYQDDFIKRADEATRFKPKEIEKLEDRELEAIVANYFSMTQLGNELWAGLSGPALVRLHDASPPIGVKAPTTATTLLNMTKEAAALSGSITFQERVAFIGKDGGERSFRKDLLRVEVSDRINLVDAGAAMLRGFDVPAFRKDIQREIRKTHQVPSVREFWRSWLQELSNAVRTMEASFREILDIDGNQEAGILPVKSLAPELTAEVANA
jgi:hypothetical protein